MPDRTQNDAPVDVPDEPAVGEPAAALQEIAGTMTGDEGPGGGTNSQGNGGQSSNAPAGDVTMPDEGVAAQTEAVSRTVDDPTITAHPRSS